jgi:hypothetical protein
MASRWESTAPFYLVQYTASAQYYCDTCTQGSPAMASVPSIDRAQSVLHFSTPAGTGSLVPFAHFANVTISTAAEANTTLDGKPIASFQRVLRDSLHEVFVAMNIGSGPHTLASTAPATVMTYGEAAHDGYRSPVVGAPELAATIDSLAPEVSFAEQGECIRVNLADTGSAIADIVILSSSGVQASFDPAYVSGQRLTHSFVDLCAFDAVHRSDATLVIHDRAGNSTIVTIHHAGLALGNVAQTISDFDTVTIGDTRRLDKLTIVDTSAMNVTIDSVWIADQSPANSFSIDASGVPFTLATGVSKAVAISFHPQSEGLATATVGFRIAGVGNRTLVIRGIGLRTVLAVDATDPNLSDDELARWLVSQSTHATSDRDQLKLLPISPNPTTGHFTLRYALRSQSVVNLSIFNLLGQPIYQTQDRIVGAGVHEESIDLSSLEAGTYIYRLDASGSVNSGRISVIR